ncbi:MAG: BRCT domain-containing protein [Inconstantimicrobium porci]|uniref:BRCT domain-containing protein n=1 Tax=Inconstantimicrobium porci TaxID=2652291 RepID=UPI002A90FEC1|nr:BRCT domain-containing protein [Inconstantimicrobium porci]MDY5911424.1 BRCT domain-containing protein [Inconstantimicrobium porci]
MSKDRVNDLISLIHKQQPNLFSYDVVDLIDFYNSERNLPRNNEERYDAVFEIAESLGISEEAATVKRYTDFNEEKRKTFYRRSEITYGAFSGRNIVFTGKGPFVRGELMSLARRAGAEISSAVSSRTNLLVVGSKPGSKLRKAKRLNMDIITIEEFFNILEGKSALAEDISEIDKLVEVYGEVLERNYYNKNISILIKDDKLKSKICKVFSSSCKAQIIDFDHKKTDILIYQLYYENNSLLQIAEDNNIQIMSLGEFNRNLMQLSDTCVKIRK